MQTFYLFGSRMATHIAFWLGYFLLFGFIWANDGNYRDSYFLEFVLLPVRMLAVYFTIYWLIPRWLHPSTLLKLAVWYILFITCCSLLQRGFTFFFYEGLSFTLVEYFDFRGIVRSMVLINSTVLFVSALKITWLWWQECERSTELSQQLEQRDQSGFIEIKAEKRTHRVAADSLLYVEALGNYVIFHTIDKQYISYISLKQVLNNLPAEFRRIHKSFIINTAKVSSYDQENIEINGKLLPVGRAYKDQIEIL